MIIIGCQIKLDGILVVDGKGNIVIHKGIEDRKLDTDICKVAIDYGVDFMDNGFVEGKEYFLSSSNKFENSWKLFYYVDRSEITADVVSILISDIVIALILFALAFVVASVYASVFTALGGSTSAFSMNFCSVIPYRVSSVVTL